MIVLALLAQLGAASPAPAPFDSARDVIALHYDHAPDLDDGQSASADRTVLQSTYGTRWMGTHLVIVSGTCGLNAPTFVKKSDRVMRVVWGDRWLAAHDRWKPSVSAAAARWTSAIERGGRVWVKEGGQSDFTADVVALIKVMRASIDPRRSVIVVQHSDWNEQQTTPAKLAYTKANTHYVRIRDANAYDALPPGDSATQAFIDAATSSKRFARYWRASFAYYPARVDFSDTGELTHILGLGEIGVADFARRFLTADR